jgi:hypothetical protein
LNVGMVTDITRAEIGEHCEALETALARLDVDALSGARASQVLRRVARTRHACAELEGRLARRVERTGIWRQGGHKSAAQFLAAATGTSVGAATAELATAERLESLPETADAYRAGRLSPGQAAEIANATVAAPDAEYDLLLSARTETYSHFRDHCRRVKAAHTDLNAAHRRIHAARSLRTWTDAEGAWQLHASGTVTDGATIMAALNAETDVVFRAARAEGRREPHEAYAFDALVRVAARERTDRAASSGPKAHVHVNVDAEPLLAAQATPGGTCEIPGIGPIPVEAARAYLGDALLTVIVKKGVDVTTVAHHGRTVPTAVRRAVEARDPECVNATCSAREHLEIHHLEDWVRTHTTIVDGVVRVCRWDHYLITHCGYTLTPRGEGEADGTYDLIPPGHDP